MHFKTQADALFYLTRIHAAATYTITNGYSASATEAASAVTRHLDPILTSQSVSYIFEETNGPTFTHINSPNGETVTLQADESKVWAEQFLAGGWPATHINNAMQLINNIQ